MHDKEKNGTIHKEDVRRQKDKACDKTYDGEYAFCPDSEHAKLLNVHYFSKVSPQPVYSLQVNHRTENAGCFSS
jgi:hypothetical protein